MVYVDSSVFIAHLLSEDRRPAEQLWAEPLASSRLLEVEAWNRLHAHGWGDLGDDLRALLARLSLLEMDEPVLARAIEPFPIPVRALDAIHLASADCLRRTGHAVSMATYDTRMGAAAREMGFELYPLE
jgi:predicted nucleic acid-binding protein